MEEIRIGYIDLTPGELERLYKFHEKYPNGVLRVYSDKLISFEQKTYSKKVSDLQGHETDIADPTFE